MRAKGSICGGANCPEATVEHYIGASISLAGVVLKTSLLLALDNTKVDGWNLSAIHINASISLTDVVLDPSLQLAA